MKKQISRVSPLRNASFMALLCMIMSMPYGLLYWLMPRVAGVMLPAWSLVAVPVGYTAFGFLFTLVGAWIYNLAAAGLGGFEFTTMEVGDDATAGPTFVK